MLTTLVRNCFGEQDVLAKARTQTTLWETWLTPITSDQPVGEDPAYDDDFLRMREEVNKLSGADTALVIELAEKLLTTVCKDVRVATYYLWARLHQEGEAGLAEGLSLLAALTERFGEALLPSRPASRKSALEWLAGSKIQDSLSLYPEVNHPDFERLVAALALLDHCWSQWDDAHRPHLGGLISVLDTRLAQSGGMDAVVPQTSAHTSDKAPVMPQYAIQSGRDLLDQAREMAHYLRDQPQGWLSSARLMRAIRWDTVHQLPPQDTSGCTRLPPPRAELRALLKRFYLQQNWNELLEQVERMFIEGVNHFWLDLQWYAWQALSRAGYPYSHWAPIIRQDLAHLLERLPGLEQQAYNDGTPFADDVTLAWIEQHVRENSYAIEPSAPAASSPSTDAILALESEALDLADTQGVEAALRWLNEQPGQQGRRERWLIKLLMARIAEQYGKNDMALYLFSELDQPAIPFDLAQWEPDYVFEVKARLLKLLRLKLQRSDADKTHLQQRVDQLTAGLVAIDAAKAMVLC